MKTKTLSHHTLSVLAAAFVVAALALAPIAPQLASADYQDRYDRGERGNRYAYGHQVHIPPFIYFLAEWENRYGWLPPGLARLLDRYEPYLEDDGDVADMDPKLTDSSVEAGLTDATIMLSFDEDVQARIFLSPESGFEKDDDGVMRDRERSYMDEHEFSFSELTEGTEYFYFVEFRDEDGNLVTSDEMSFMTEEAVDETDPELTEVTTDAGTATATLAFDFSEVVQARLFVATYSGFQRVDADVARITNRDFMSTQEFTLEDLDPDTEYFYLILFRDADGNLVLSDEMSFMTEAEVVETDETAPEVLSFTVDPATSTADFSVELDEVAQVRLFVSPTPGFNRTTSGVIEETSTEYLTEHHFMIDGLSPDTEYYYLISYRDESHNGGRTTENSFMTDAETDTSSPVISSIETDIGTSSITVSWATDEPATSAIYTATSSGFGLTDAGVVLTDTTGLSTDHELTITGLSASTTYYHRIVTEDAEANETVSDELTVGTS